jgi:hypothetical protein
MSNPKWWWSRERRAAWQREQDEADRRRREEKEQARRRRTDDGMPDQSRIQTIAMLYQPVDKVGRPDIRHIM